MRTIGLSWNEWRTAWSSSKDEHIGTVEQLQEHLKAVLEEELRLSESGALPSKTGSIEVECPTPQLRRKTFKALGTPTVQAASLSNDVIELSQEELLAQAQRRRIELEEKGEIDWVCDRLPYPTGQES